MSFFEKLKAALTEVFEYEYGLRELKSDTYEGTFPDCPSCGNWINSDCEYKKKCFVLVDEYGFRNGTPTQHRSVRGD